MMVSRVLDLLRRDGGGRRHPALPPSLPISPLEQAWLFASNPEILMERGRRELGDVFTLDVPKYGPIVMFMSERASRKLVEAPAADFGNVNDIGAFFLGPNSILFLEGEAHVAARARTMAAITGERMRSYASVIVEAADRFIDALRPGGRFDALDVARELSMAVIFQALLGLKDGPVYDRLTRLAKRFIDGGHTSLATMMALYMPAKLLRPLVFGPRDPQTMRLLPPRGLYGLAGRLPPIRAGRELLDAILDHIEWRMRHLDQGDDDALGFILRRASASGRPYSAAEALDETLTILLAGHDTTAIVLAWTLFHLGRTKTAQVRLAAELDAAFPDRRFDPRVVERLPYLRAVVDETFRMNGIARNLSRRLKRDLVFEGYSLPAGTIVSCYTHLFTRDPQKFATPASFDPAQMLGKKLRPHEFTPFGGGYRRCVGASFAEYELALLIGRIAQRVSFRTPAGTTVGVGMLGPLFAPDRPIPIDVESVRPASSK